MAHSSCLRPKILSKSSLNLPEICQVILNYNSVAFISFLLTFVGSYFGKKKDPIIHLHHLFPLTNGKKIFVVTILYHIILYDTTAILYGTTILYL